jgi:tRNA A-37 threonylcarbamoyl transferase component Bud32
VLRDYSNIEAGGRRFVLGKSLGEGSFKQAFEAYEVGKGARAGEKFIYTKLLPGAPEGVQWTTPFLRTGTAGAVEGSLGLPEAKRFVETFSQSMQAHVAKFAEYPLGAEIAAQQMARKAYGSTVPEVIGATKKGFVQEFAGTVLPESHVGKAFQAAKGHYNKVLAHSGTKVVHYDLHPGNILRKGSKLSIIDWGLAAPTAVTPEIAQTGKQLMDFYVKRSMGRVFPQKVTHTVPMEGKGAFSRAGTPEELTRQLEAAQQKVVEEAVKRRRKLNMLQEGAQPLPFKLNAKRRTSHGVERSSRVKTQL